MDVAKSYEPVFGSHCCASLNGTNSARVVSDEKAVEHAREFKTN